MLQLITSPTSPEITAAFHNTYTFNKTQHKDAAIALKSLLWKGAQTNCSVPQLSPRHSGHSAAGQHAAGSAHSSALPAPRVGIPSA